MRQKSVKMCVWDGIIGNISVWDGISRNISVWDGIIGYVRNIIKELHAPMINTDSGLKRSGKFSMRMLRFLHISIISLLKGCRYMLG